MSVLSERSVLMRFSARMPGKHRKDKSTTEEVKNQKGLGDKAGNWVTDLWPENALKDIQAVQGDARRYHDKVTFPFGSRKEEEQDNKEANRNGGSAIAGIGILPAVLIMEYGDKMREFQGKLEAKVEEFLANPRQWIDWAVKQHNGTFNPKNYPGVEIDASGALQFDEEVFRTKMRKRFGMSTEALPVPDSQQFTASVTALLGVDAQAVDLRIADATQESQRELMRRMIQPVTHMAFTLANKPCPCDQCATKRAKPKKGDTFKDTLISNIEEIVKLGPKLNITGDPGIDAFFSEMDGLTRYAPDSLRSDQSLRDEAAAKALETMNRLSGYKI